MPELIQYAGESAEKFALRKIEAHAGGGVREDIRDQLKPMAPYREAVIDALEAGPERMRMILLRVGLSSKPTRDEMARAVNATPGRLFGDAVPYTPGWWSLLVRWMTAAGELSHERIGGEIHFRRNTRA